MERTVYSDFLGPLGLGSPRCYGYIADADGTSAWLFLEEARGIPYAEENPVHRVVASSWLGQMHAATSALNDAGTLPTVGLDRYRRFLDLTEAFLVRDAHQPERTEPPPLALRIASQALARLADRWVMLEDLWLAAPRCLVHGDFIAKNALVNLTGADPSIWVLDWEVSGWGVPAEDLAGLDIPVYSAHAAGIWKSYGEERLRNLATIGAALRELAFLQAYSALNPKQLALVSDKISVHGERLYAIEDTLGW